MKSFLITMCCLACFSLEASANDANDAKKAYLNAEEAGPAFAIQGEYTGPIKVGDNEVKIGVQVISEGNSKLA